MYLESRDGFKLNIIWCFLEDRTKSLKGIIIVVSLAKKFNYLVSMSEIESLSHTTYREAKSKEHRDLGKNFWRIFFNYYYGIVMVDELRVRTIGYWTWIDFTKSFSESLWLIWVHFGSLPLKLFCSTGIQWIAENPWAENFTVKSPTVIVWFLLPMKSVT